ncbi:Aldo/keto reductase [Backusella circina FSU 941]|nr:Aldo/keto reductase [Backusella circina FSU 941]
MSTGSKMQYVRLGNTGLKVSRICMGCMSFGSSKWMSWVKEGDEAIEVIKAAYDAGINFFDTADTYSNGESEIILGKALREVKAPRSRVVIATKFYGPVYDDVGKRDLQSVKHNSDMMNRWGTSRKHIFDAVDASLERLGVDYIDLYQVHRLDGFTPLEETMEALNDLVRSGKVRYIGASLMKAWEFQKMNHIAEKNGWARFISMQNCYNLIYREDERELIPYSLDAGVSGMIYSPLAGGVLTGKNRQTERSENSVTILGMYKNMDQESNEVIFDRIDELSKKRNVSWAQISLAWLMSKPYVASPIVGISKVSHLEDAVKSVELELTEEEIKYLEEPYTARPDSITRF